MEICTLLVMQRIIVYWFWLNGKVSTVNGSDYPYTLYKNLEYFIECALEASLYIWGFVFFLYSVKQKSGIY